MAKYSLQFQENAMRHQRAHAGALAQTRKPCRRAQSSLQALPAGADRARHSTHRAGVQQPQVCNSPKYQSLPPSQIVSRLADVGGTSPARQTFTERCAYRANYLDKHCH